MKRVLRQVFYALLLCAAAAQSAVRLDFFYEPGCGDCEHIEQAILPQVRARFGDACDIRRFDIGIETNFLYLLRMEEAAGRNNSQRPYLVVENRHFFGSNPGIEDLVAVISTAVTSKASPPAVPACESGDPAGRSFRQVTWSAVLLGGLLDGLNPCAISTLVFFMSLLAVSGVRDRPLLVLGASYCLASFATYLVLGFGLLRLLHLFAGFTILRTAFEWGMMIVLSALAVYSFRDAVRFRVSRDARDVTLQLSSGMKKRIHSVMRRGLKTNQLLWGGLVTGMLVTALESVCTGQVYVPTLVVILKRSHLADARAWLYLIAYNLLFIFPLLLTFIAVYFGLRTETLLRWSRRNVVLSKVLLGLFFLLMTLLVAWL